MIDNVDPKQGLDEGVRSIVNYLRDLEKNLVMYIIANLGLFKIRLMMKSY